MKIGRREFQVSKDGNVLRYEAVERQLQKKKTQTHPQKQ